MTGDAFGAVPQPARRIVGVLLAAGRGRRFDPSGRSDKLMQPIDGVPVAARAAESLRGLCEPVLAVVRPQRPQLESLLRERGCLIVVCGDADSGMGHSLAAGAGAAVALVPDAVVVLPADMPCVSRSTVRRLLERPLEQPAHG
ncbi:MAG TPA: NTP transferase domain-containing protein, partial [Burkholderiaceae bacterium]|nr:NTP transferase domain-containing protein [Burkholderiaceae bacterium]